MLWKRIKENIDKTLLGSLTLLVFFILQFMWFLSKPTDLVPLWVLYLLIIVFYICCVFLYAICKSKTVEVQYRLPRVLTVSGSAEQAILVLEKNELFSHHTIVTIYHQDGPDDLEVPIAIGVVQTINQQGHPQIQMTDPLKPDIIKDLFPAKRTLLTPGKWKTVYVKPTVVQDYLEGGWTHE